MATPLPLCPDFEADTLRREARRSRDAALARRPLALTAMHEGGTRGAPSHTVAPGLSNLRWLHKACARSHAI